MSSTPPPTAENAPDDALLVWRVHRLRDYPRRLPLIVFGYGVAVLLWRLSLPNPFLLMAILFVLTAALGDFWFPVTYRLTTQGAHADGLFSRLHLAWPDVKRATHGPDGIFLSPLPRPSRLDAFRGIRLPYGDNAKETLRATVKDLIDKQRKGNVE